MCIEKGICAQSLAQEDPKAKAAKEEEDDDDEEDEDEDDEDNEEEEEEVHIHADCHSCVPNNMHQCSSVDILVVQMIDDTTCLYHVYGAVFFL